MFRNSTSSSDSNSLSNHQSEPLYSLSPNSTDEASHLRRNGSNFRRSLKKLQTRMKNCFSRSSRHRTQRINRTQAQRNSQPFTPDQQVSNYSPSRLTGGMDNQPRSPTPSGRTQNDYASRNNSLSHCVWYWGHVSKPEVITRLDGTPDGSFLVRDSESDSFRSFGLTLHARIEYTSNGYKLFEQEGYSSVKELIEKSIEVSEKGILCYTKSSSEQPNFPVRLLKPISRYDEVQSLLSISRFVIRQHVNLNDIEKLCLPQTLIAYLKEKNYFR
ncbi:suppressor of cytokine signaling 6-like isoform X2 [Rhynchophorus ferrugineus]|uniref:suppressor of cytokine signaling 6-like isoform X2 n=1 Tax=Rhynchophorus ferrugineus TaxID=354439 RepID=UPI003FCDEAB0